MGRKSKLSMEDLAKIISRAVEIAEIPIQELDFDLEDHGLDEAFQDMPAPSSGENIRLMPSPRASLVGRTRICIRIESRTLHAIKSRAASMGVPYQTLVNSVLRKASEGFV